MFEFLSQELNELYGEDKKKLRTNTILYGHLEEGRWHTHLQPPLSSESIAQFEAGLKQEFPPQYKNFLSLYNGCYIFDLLRVAGKEPDTFKGMSIEEQAHSPFPLEYMKDLYLRKRTPKSHFIFADSVVKNTYYVIDVDSQVLEMDFRTKKIINTYEDLKIFLYEILFEGKENLTNGIYYEFE
ncbi:SMI1/KNR4 family protein [Neobacillus mesonae]|uniref:SMI1/KNR4 family protein n=1 Tax=Neobacillus mesonae TaxID=1193713 RepID=UPI002573D801|nr:SMI1/KNR4 family protein [Neobacillus mesonae]